MFRIRYICILCFIFINLSKAQRRVVDGKTLSDRSQPFVVYLIKANESVPYDAWMCGGAIVTKEYILTSAACVEDVKFMYAIAGYNKYVKYGDLHTDRCTSNTKKKVVYVCLQKNYNFDYPKMEDWANIDIALVKVESAFDQNNRYQDYCSYKPCTIEINYDIKLQAPDIDAIVFGWGHTEKWRSTDDTQDHNQHELLWGAVRLANKEECKRHFDESRIKSMIDKYMICSMHEGGYDVNGNAINNHDRTYAKECNSGAIRVGDECLSDYYYSRRKGGNVTLNETRRKGGNVTLGETRRKGICQNDHGGPLITWRGPKAVLIGVASAFKVEAGTRRCTAPFLYTSTHCNGHFLHCILNGNSDDLRQKCEQLAKEGGFSFVRRSISWSSHPDGPAENEGKELRETRNEPDQENTRFESPFKYKFLGI